MSSFSAALMRAEPRAAAQRCGLYVEWRPHLAALAEEADSWRALAADACEPNAFYEPGFALAAIPPFGRDVGALVIREEQPDRKPVGLVPLRIERRRFAVPLPVLCGWTHPFAPLGVPLVRRGMAEAVASCLVDYLRTNSNLPRTILLPSIPVQGPFGNALAAELTRRNMKWEKLGQHERAVLDPGPHREGYVEHAVGAKRRKELRRQRRRLEETGPVSSAIVRDPSSIAAILGEFIRLEGAGWKGRAGSAAAQRPDTLAFMTRAVTTLAAEGKVRAACLRHNGHAIAAALVLVSADVAWFWKIAFDETGARASPGVQLALDVTDILAKDVGLRFTDSCAVADHPMIDHLWRERLALADILFTTGAPTYEFAAVSSLERLRRLAFSSAARVRRRLQRR